MTNENETKNNPAGHAASGAAQARLGFNPYESDAGAQPRKPRTSVPYMYQQRAGQAANAARAATTPRPPSPSAGAPKRASLWRHLQDRLRKD
jgi:hypothetical protein